MFEVPGYAYEELVTVHRAYETNRVDYVENSVNGNTLSKYDYANDTVGRRTSVGYTGSAFTGTNFDVWQYDARSEIVDSRRGESADSPPLNEVVANRRLYTYDPIGNRTERTEGTDRLYYCTNNVNQYTATDGAQDCPSPTETFDYDLDGNMTGDDTFTYTWDGENRLKSAYKTRGR